MLILRNTLLALLLLIFIIPIGCKEEVDGSSRVYTAPLSFNTSTLPGAVVGQYYTTTISVRGGTVPYSFTLVGTLPPGLSLSSNVISGVPTSTGTRTFIIQVGDSAGDSIQRQFSITVSISAPPLTITTTSLPGGTEGTSYSATINATGGSPPYSFTVSAGTLPPGLNLSSAGVISGTPSTANTYNFTVRVSDGSDTDLQSYSVTIASGGGGGGWDIDATNYGFITVSSASFTNNNLCKTQGSHCYSYTYVGYWEFDLSSVPTSTNISTAIIYYQADTSFTTETFAFALTSHNAPLGGSNATAAAQDIAPTSGSGGTQITGTLSESGTQATVNSSGINAIENALGGVIRMGPRDLSYG